MAFFSDPELASFVDASRAEAAAREAMVELSVEAREDVIQSWRRSGRLDELLGFYNCLIKKFGEMRGARPLEHELEYALGEFAWIDSPLDPAHAAHIYVLASTAWRDALAEVKREGLGEDEEQELYVRRHFELGVEVGRYLQSQAPRTPQGAFSTAHHFAARGFQAPWW